MKKILFIIGSLQSGGVSKSMVNLLNAIDKEKYHVDLFILSLNGTVYDRYIPHGVNIIVNKDVEYLHDGFAGVKNLFLRGNVKLAIGSLARMILSRFNKSLSGLLLAKLMPPIHNEYYDLIVDYGGQQQLYYMVDKLKALKKITFFHNDYSKWPYYFKADKIYYPKVDAIFSISDKCVDVLKEWFPDQADKIELMENIVAPDILEKLSSESVDNPWPHSCLKLMSLGHVIERKGSHWALSAAKILKDNNINFHWVFVGYVPEPQRWDSMIEELDLKNRITFLGIKPNPYPYLKMADIIVHPSQYEGKSIALDEAKLLCKPIVVTNFSTVHDQFENGVNATICEMNPESIANAIEQLAIDEDLRDKYIDYLRNHKADNSSEIEKIYDLL